MGFPVHAGIDPRGSKRGVESSWIPRTRGDRPSPQTFQEWLDRDSPYTRG